MYIKEIQILEKEGLQHICYVYVKVAEKREKNTIEI